MKKIRFSLFCILCFFGLNLQAEVALSNKSVTLLQYADLTTALADMGQTPGARVEINSVSIQNLTQGDVILFSLPFGATYSFQVAEIQTTKTGSVHIISKMTQNGQIFSSLFTLGAGFFANISTPDGVFKISSDQISSYLLDLSKLDNIQLEGFDDTVLPRPKAAKSVKEKGAFKATLPTTGTATIDLLALYSSDLANSLGLDVIHTKIEYFVALANQAYKNSNISIQLNLVNTASINASLSTSAKDINTTLTNLSSSADIFSNAATLRQTYGADLVTYLRQFDSSVDPSACGLGFLNGGDLAVQTSGLDAMSADNGFSVVNVGKDIKGTNLDCSDYVLAHELGHNMGSAHDLAHATGAAGAYSYSYGYGSASVFGTIMSYISPRVGYFSSPNITCVSNTACGVSDSADNARSINNTRFAVAAFTQTPPSTISTTPSAFKFSPVTGVVPGSILYSETVTISGITQATPISITGGFYSINGAAFTSGSGTITSGQNVQIKLTASTSSYTTTTAMLTIGDVSSAFRLSTGMIGSSSANLTAPIVVASENFSLAVRSDNSIWTWGHNDLGELGLANTTNLSNPAQLVSLTNVINVASAYKSSLALTSSGTVWGWGENTNYNLGTGTNVASSSPLQISTLGSNVAGIAIGGASGAALNKNGTVFGWINFAPTPSLVSGISNATLLVGAPDDHYAVLLSDGTLKLWGANGSGQLGNGTTSQYYTSTPVSMTNLGAIKQVAVGAGFTLILKSDGTVWSWGDNAYGQLGNGTTVSSLVPVQVTGLSNVASISTSWYHCFAIMSDGTLKAWGKNDSSQLGDGTTTNTSTPKTISGISSVASISVGYNHSLAIQTNGSVWAWGNNYYGQFGNGTTTGSKVPVSISNTWYLGDTNEPTNSFVFTPQTTTPGTTATSNTVTISGINYPSPVSISKGAYSLDGGSYTSASGFVSNGQNVTLQLNAPSSLGSSNVTTLVVGGVSSTFQVTAVGVTTTSTTTSTVASTTTTTVLNQSVSLVPGWNLIGNGYSNTFSVSSLFGNPDLIKSVWKWVASSSTWAFYSPSLTSDQLSSYAQQQTYQVLSTISPGDGFWVNSAIAQSVTLTGGSKVLSSSFASTGTNALAHGWSLIAIGDNNSPDAFNTSLGGTPPSSGQAAGNVNTIWSWDAVQLGWYFYSPTLVNNGTLSSYISNQSYESFGLNKLTPTTGFWVNMP
jgi:hypothetical protein